MELCRAYRIPHSYFRGHGDGTWSDLDRRKALALEEHRRQVCPSCGTRAEEWDENTGGDEFAYTAITHRCLGCQTIADRQEEVPQGPEGHGVKVALIPTSVRAALEIARTAQHD
jgi:hypothetical protein